MELSGKRVLVTGTSKGIGRAIALVLVEAGCEVWGVSRQAAASSDWPDALHPLSVDLSFPEEVETAWREGKWNALRFDILVNNAGAATMGPFEDVSFEQWERQIGLLLRSPLKLMHLMMQCWRDQGRKGVIVNIGSLATEFPMPFLAGYNAGKAALAAATESLLLEGSDCLQAAIELRLGDIRTEFNQGVTRQGDSKKLRSVWAAMEKHVAGGPPASKVARRLVKALRQDEKGVLRVGTFFQVWVASLGGKFLWQSQNRAANLRYYDLD